MYVPICWSSQYNEVANAYTEEEFEDTKRVIRIRKSKDRQHNGQKKKDKQRYTNITKKTKDRVTRTPLKTGGELGCANTLLA